MAKAKSRKGNPSTLLAQSYVNQVARQLKEEDHYDYHDIQGYLKYKLKASDSQARSAINNLKESNPSTLAKDSNWIKGITAIRRLPTGEIQIATTPGTLSNPGKKKKIVGEIKKLFSAGKRMVSNPPQSKTLLMKKWRAALVKGNRYEAQRIEKLMRDLGYLGGKGIKGILGNPNRIDQYVVEWGNDFNFFDTLAKAKKYKAGLYSRGLLFGRKVKIVKMDKDSGEPSKVMFEKEY